MGRFASILENKRCTKIISRVNRARILPAFKTRTVFHPRHSENKIYEFALRTLRILSLRSRR
jgi:hypothetical protein